mmetsp:Transcript_18566/g.16170  ORF Transcript_18566/g.16170 Transcript_18566/m.16170 type:complete len:94 (-) Transcript_18566:454-735(-)
MIYKKNPVFLPDDRNLGGVTQIYVQKSNHKKALKVVRPQIHSLEPPFSYQQPKLYSPRQNREKSFGTPKTSNNYYAFPLTTRKHQKKDDFLRE